MKMQILLQRKGVGGGGRDLLSSAYLWFFSFKNLFKHKMEIFT